MCINCLRKGHRVSSCPSQRACFKCSEKHNNLLHQEKVVPQLQPKSKSEDKPAADHPLPAATTKAGPSVPARIESGALQQTSCSSSGFLKSPQQVLLQTAIINVTDKNGRLHPCRTLLDTGSQAHILSEEMARKLGLSSVKCNVTVIGANAVKTQATKGVSLSFFSTYCDFRDSIFCLLSEKPTGRIPSHSATFAASRSTI